MVSGGPALPDVLSRGEGLPGGRVSEERGQPERKGGESWHSIDRQHCTHWIAHANARTRHQKGGHRREQRHQMVKSPRTNGAQEWQLHEQSTLVTRTTYSPPSLSPNGAQDIYAPHALKMPAPPHTYFFCKTRQDCQARTTRSKPRQTKNESTTNVKRCAQRKGTAPPQKSDTITDGPHPAV